MGKSNDASVKNNLYFPSSFKMDATGDYGNMYCATLDVTTFATGLVPSASPLSFRMTTTSFDIEEDFVEEL